MEKFTGQEAGRGGLISFKQSNWLWWGYGIYPKKSENFVKKPMTDCTGAELLREVLGRGPVASSLAS